MPIDFKHKAVFVHIPKTGGQAISHYLGIGRNIKKNLYADGLTHMTLPMIEERVDITGMYIFTFVRNPYDRIASEYSWRMRNRTSAVYNEPTRDRVSFDDYMELLLYRWHQLSKEWRERAHVVPQVEYLTDERINIFRHENFGAECEILARMFGLTHKPTRVNVGKDTPKHTERTREITRQLYADDFKRLNYEI